MTLLAYHSGGLKQLSREPTAAALSKTTQLRPKGTPRKANYGRLLQHTQALILGGTVRRITKAVLGGLAGSALVLGGTQAASAALEAKFWFRDGLTDLVPTAPGPFDSATAKTTITERTDKTTFRLHVRGIDPSVAGNAFAAHLHVGPCGNTGGHYKDDPLGPADRENEVWFDLVPDEEGVASDDSSVSFVPVDGDPAYVRGEMSIVIHALPNDTTVSPNPKQACFPLSVPQWIPAATE